MEHLKTSIVFRDTCRRTMAMQREQQQHMRADIKKHLSSMSIVSQKEEEERGGGILRLQDAF